MPGLLQGRSSARVAAFAEGFVVSAVSLQVHCGYWQLEWETGDPHSRLRQHARGYTYASGLDENSGTKLAQPTQAQTQNAQPRQAPSVNRIMTAPGIQPISTVEDRLLGGLRCRQSQQHYANMCWPSDFHWWSLSTLHFYTSWHSLHNLRH